MKKSKKKMEKSKKKINSYEEEKAVVTFGLGATLNAGDFESVRINFSLSLECPKSKIQDTIKKVKSEVKKQMKMEIENAREMLKNEK